MAQKGKITNVILCMIFAAVIGFFVACSTDEDTLYTCTYEVRYSACGGSPWNDWQEECYQFDLDDYIEGWTAEDVCNKFTGSDIECGGGCCIYVEYRNNQLSGSDACP